MSWPTYPQYHDTGISELPKVPSNWNVCRLKHLATIRNGRDFKEVEVESGGYPVLGSGGSFAQASTYLFSSESVLLGRKGTIDKPLYVNQPFWAVDTMFYTEIGSNCHGRFLYYVARTIDFARYATNTALPSMAQEDLANVYCPAPSLFEQTQIADFLDHETARIDALVEKQQRLINLLQEKRQAVISHAVTSFGTKRKGRLGYYVDLLPGYAFRSEHFNQDDGIHLLRGINVGVGEVSWDDTVYWPYEKSVELQPFELEVADIVMGMDRPWISTGTRIAKISDTDIPALLVQRVARLRAKPGLIPDYLYLILSSNVFRQAVESDLTGVSVPHISPEQMKGFMISLPLTSEQEAICKRTFHQLENISNTIRQATELIGLLTERRSALISAAVTGKMDVRGWKPQDAPVEHDLPMAAEAEAQYG